MSIEGQLRVGVRIAQGRIDQVRIDSTRPDVAPSLLVGRSRAEAQAAAPSLFSICSRSQGTASQLACAAASGEAATGALLEAGRAAVAAEMVREGSLHALLHWPRWIGEEPGPAAMAAARASLSYSAGSPATDTIAQSIALASFGAPATQWLSLQTWADISAWAAAGATASARFVHQALREDNATVEARTLPLLPPPAAAWLSEWAMTNARDAGFAQRPVWQGAPAETGVLARLQLDPLIASPGALPGGRPPTRLLGRWVARLRELALLLVGCVRPAVGALRLADGSGLAWVDNARGLLTHQVHLDGGRVQRYRIVAPTEWNFHPQGALAQALLGVAVANADAARRLATRMVQSLDPCVEFRVELDHA
jgi:uptake hydrogenase large subunit